PGRRPAGRPASPAGPSRPATPLPSWPALASYRSTGSRLFRQRPLPLLQQTHERRFGADHVPPGPDECQGLVTGPAVPGHQVRRPPQAAAADAAPAVDEDHPPSVALDLDEADLLSQPVEARGRLRVRDRLPAVDGGPIRVCRLAEVQDIGR